MFSTREIERELYKCPEINCQDSEYSYIDKEEMLVMESEYYMESDKIHIFPFISYTLSGEPIVEFYIWDYMLYPKVCKRFVICEGLRLTDKEEKSYLSYVKELSKYDLIIVHNIDTFNKGVSETFPSWHYLEYTEHQFDKAMSHIYFASHRSGVREILYKSSLINIGYHIDSIIDYNIIGTSPRDILGMPMKLLRILNHSSLVHNLFAKDTMDFCKKVYEKYSGYIGKEQVSPAQWSYFELLYSNSGIFGDRPFSRALYNKLESQWGTNVVYDYGRFYEFKSKIPEVKIRLLKPMDLKEVLEELDIAYEYKFGSKMKENTQIIRRSKDDTLEFANQEYIVRMPRDGVDICLEAIKQGNCLTSFIDSHAYADTTIMFIRKRDEPERPYITMEIKDNVITQAYGQGNTLLKSEDYCFLERYAYVKGIEFYPENLIFGDDVTYEVDESLIEYLEKYSARQSYPTFICSEEEYYQLTIFDCLPKLKKGVRSYA